MHTAIRGNPDGISLDVSGPVVDLDTCRDAADMQGPMKSILHFSKFSFFLFQVVVFFFLPLMLMILSERACVFHYGFLDRKWHLAHTYMFPIAIMLTDFAIQFVT